MPKNCRFGLRCANPECDFRHPEGTNTADKRLSNAIYHYPDPLAKALAQKMLALMQEIQTLKQEIQTLKQEIQASNGDSTRALKVYHIQSNKILGTYNDDYEEMENKYGELYEASEYGGVEAYLLACANLNSPKWLTKPGFSECVEIKLTAPGVVTAVDFVT